MTESNINVINENREKIKEIFDLIKEPFMYATERNLDRHMNLAIKMKRIGVEEEYGQAKFFKLDKNNRVCHMPVLNEAEKVTISEMSTLFLYLDMCILKNTPTIIDKKNLHGFYFKYKDWYFVAYSNDGPSSSYYQLTTVKPMRGRKPIEIIPYNELRRRAHH